MLFVGKKAVGVIEAKPEDGGPALFNLLHFDMAFERATGNAIADNVGWLDFTHALIAMWLIATGRSNFDHSAGGFGGTSARHSCWIPSLCAARTRGPFANGTQKRVNRSVGS